MTSSPLYRRGKERVAEDGCRGIMDVRRRLSRSKVPHGNTPTVTEDYIHRNCNITGNYRYIIYITCLANSGNQFKVLF